jgi:hypothetical protein
MTGEELRAARTEMRLTGETLAQALSEGAAEKLYARTVRRWESGERAIPPTVTALVTRLLEEWRLAWRQTEIGMTKLRQGAREDWPPKVVALAHYPDAESLAAFKPEDPSLTPSLQRALNRAMAARLADEGIGHEIIKMDLVAYKQWLGSRKNTAPNRAEFAAHQRAHGLRLGLNLGYDYRDSTMAIGWALFELGGNDKLVGKGVVKV